MERHEEDISSVEGAAQAHPRLPGQDGDDRWQEGIAAPACEGPQAIGGLGYRLRPDFRLRGAAQYKRVLMQGTRKKSAKGVFDLTLIANGVGGARLGYIVPKRLTPSAVQRNRIKRQIREIFRRARADLPAVDLVVRQIGAVKLMRRTQILHELSTLISSIENAQ